MRAATDTAPMPAYPPKEHVDAAEPVLRKLVPGKRKIPHIQQLEWTDCGAACLGQVLGFHGHEVTLAEAKREMPVGRDGVSARDIIEAGARFGLRGRGVSLDVNEVERLPRGAILHWEFSHFVVLDRVRGDVVELVDPAFGPRRITRAELSKAFTGVAILLEPGEGFVTAKRDKIGPYRALWQELWGHRRELNRALFLSLLLRLFALAMPLLTAAVVDRVVPRGDVNLLFVVFLGAVIMIAFTSVSTLIRTHVLLGLRTKMDAKMTLGFLEHMVCLPYAFFQTRSTGDLLMRVRSNATIREIITTNTMSALLDGLFVLLYAATITIVSPLMAGLVFGLALLNGVVFLASKNKHHELMVRDLEIQAKSQDRLVQLIDGIQTLKSSGVELQAVGDWSKHYIDEVNLSLKRGRLSAAVEAIGGLLQGIGPILLLSAGALLVVRGQLSLGAMLAVNALALGVFGPVQSLLSSAIQLQLLTSYLDRIADVNDAPREQEGKTVRNVHRLAGHVAAQNVTFRYQPSSAPVLAEVSLEISPGATVAVVGASGSGKSTLASLLCGLHLPDEGRILYDGHPLHTLDMRSVRRQVGVVPQHPYIFSGSIRDNIALTCPSASMDEVMRAAAIACIHDDIVAMPMGYETLVQAGGTSLSGGQRQRLAIARAVIRRPSILMLDEATSALDGVTEAQVMRNLATLGGTRIMIAHRETTIANADLIVVMERGRIIEAGSHRELSERRGAFYQLMRRNSGEGDTPLLR